MVEVRLYGCRICGAVFYDKDFVKQHLIDLHDAVEPYPFRPNNWRKLMDKDVADLQMIEMLE